MWNACNRKLFRMSFLRPVEAWKHNCGCRFAHRLHKRRTRSRETTNTFNLDSIRFYVSGPVTENISFMFNTEYNGANNTINVLDAAGQIHVNDHFNVWIGRFLPPSDRANLYGPYYANQWGVFNDGVQDGYPFVFQGRDNGALYWGDFLNKRMKVSVGGATGNTDG